MKNILTLNAISPVINDVFNADYNVANDVENPIGIQSFDPALQTIEMSIH